MKSVHTIRSLAFALRRAALAVIIISIISAAPSAGAQSATSSASDPAGALADALTAACRQDQSAFANFLTAQNAAAFRQLPQPQRTALLKRFVLLEDPGKPLLSADAQGHTIMRCDAAGITSEMHFGATEVRDNLAFIPVEVPVPGEEARSVRFGLVREDSAWKVLSVGLLLLDLPTMSRQWADADLDAVESEAIASLRKIASALKTYQRAFGKLPETLEQLGPPPPEGISPEKAGLVDAQLAAGDNGNYRFRYNIVPAPGEGDESDRNKEATFELAAAPIEYGKTGRRSFYLDSNGALHGADKQGAVAAIGDPSIGEPRP